MFPVKDILISSTKLENRLRVINAQIKELEVEKSVIESWLKANL